MDAGENEEEEDPYLMKMNCGPPALMWNSTDAKGGKLGTSYVFNRTHLAEYVFEVSKEPLRLIKVDVSFFAPTRANEGFLDMGRELTKAEDEKTMEEASKRGLINQPYWHTVPIAPGLDLDKPEQIWGKHCTGLFFPVFKEKSNCTMKAR